MKKADILPLIMLAVFLCIAVSLWLATGTIFYLFNFAYIGSVVSL